MMILDRVDLSLIHTILVGLGTFLSVYVMQLGHYDPRNGSDSWLVYELQRLGLAGLALSLLWSLLYSENRNWQPWPPDLLAFAMIDVLLATRLITICVRINRAGLRWWSPTLMVKGPPPSKVTARSR